MGRSHGSKTGPQAAGEVIRWQGGIRKWMEWARNEHPAPVRTMTVTLIITFYRALGFLLSAQLFHLLMYLIHYSQCFLHHIIFPPIIYEWGNRLREANTCLQFLSPQDNPSLAGRYFTAATVANPQSPLQKSLLFLINHSQVSLASFKDIPTIYPTVLDVFPGILSERRAWCNNPILNPTSVSFVPGIWISSSVSLELRSMS